MLDRATVDLLEPVEQRRRIGARMRLDVARHHIEPFFLERMGIFEHGVRLADAGRVTEEYLELAASRLVAALGFFDLAQNRIGIAPDLETALVNHTAYPRFVFLQGATPHETVPPTAIRL